MANMTSRILAWVSDPIAGTENPDGSLGKLRSGGLAYSARTALRFSSGLRSGTGVWMLRANMYSVFIVLSSAALEKAPWGWYCAFGIFAEGGGSRLYAPLMNQVRAASRA